MDGTINVVRISDDPAEFQNSRVTARPMATVARSRQCRSTAGLFHQLRVHDPRRQLQIVSVRLPVDLPRRSVRGRNNADIRVLRIRRAQHAGLPRRMTVLFGPSRCGQNLWLTTM